MPGSTIYVALRQKIQPGWHTYWRNPGDAGDATKIVWTSDPLPNDAIAVRKGFDPALARRIQDILVAIDADLAKTILPAHYTGFVAATHDSYKIIEQAGVTVGRLKPR